MSGSGLESLPDDRGGREALTDVQEWWKALPDVQEVSWMCGRPSRLSGSGWETIPNVWEALLDIREWSEGPPGSPEVVGI